MGFYEKVVLPRLLNLVMQNKEMARQRRTLIPEAEGRVLEIGIGSGLNLPFYGAGVREVIGVDPSLELQAYARERAKDRPFPVRFIGLSGEQIPLEDASVDVAVSTWTMCTIPDALRALEEVRRVLKPGGRLLFVEHGRAPEPGVARWQDRLNRPWGKIGGGCHLNRRIDVLVKGAGFHIDRMETLYLKGPRPMTFTYRGSAVLA
jgi:ubiquinone/menaquinone biosynthesis C-methylase UbiE